MRHKVVCLVGSTNPKWKERYREAEEKLTHAGYIVLTVVWFRDQLENFESYRKLMESIHYQKMDMSDVVVLIHKDAVGKHTVMEIEYCRNIQKPVVIYTTIEQAVKGIEALTYDL